MNDFAGAVDRNLPMLERAGVLDAERKPRRRGKHSRRWTSGLTIAVLALGFAMRWLT